MGKPDNIEEIFRRFLEDKHSLQDLQTIQDYFKTKEGDEVLSTLVERELAEPQEQDRSDDTLNRIISNSDAFILSEIHQGAKNARWINTFYRAIAALLVVGISAGIYLYTDTISKSNNQYNDATQILPGSDKAVLNLADGRTIELGGDRKQIVIKADSISYGDGNNIAVISGSTKTALNTISTPNGGQYQIVLSDGTKVWLNANSSLRYPSEFSNEQRVVELVGEAFFEVSSKSTPSGGKRPFIVKTSKQEVLVIGTQFNINAYDDEPVVKTTLLEGSVHVSSTSLDGVKSSAMLQPGQESVASSGGLSVNDAEIDQAVAWKNGKFVFNDQHFEMTMRQIARWYSVEFELVDKSLFNLRLGGTVSRSNRLSTVLEAMAATEKVAFRFERNKIYVSAVNSK